MTLKNCTVDLRGYSENLLTYRTRRDLRGRYRPSNAHFKAHYATTGSHEIDVYIPALRHVVTYTRHA